MYLHYRPYVIIFVLHSCVFSPGDERIDGRYVWRMSNNYIVFEFVSLCYDRLFATCNRTQIASQHITRHFANSALHQIISLWCNRNKIASLCFTKPACLSVRLHTSTWEQMKGLPRNFVLETSIELCRHGSACAHVPPQLDYICACEVERNVANVIRREPVSIGLHSTCVSLTFLVFQSLRRHQKWYAVFPNLFKSSTECKLEFSVLIIFNEQTISYLVPH